MTDTHTHLYLPEFDADRKDVILRAIEAGIDKMVMPNVDLETAELLQAIRHDYPEHIFTAWGLHPTSVDSSWRENTTRLLQHLDNPGCVAVGEIGIDLYWDTTYRDQQMKCLAMQLSEAATRGLPAIIHCRNGLDETLEVIGQLHKPLPQMVFHSFTGSPEDVARILSAVPEVFFGINGVVTFKNAHDLHAAIPAIGIDRIVLETDSPYLAPVPHRGKRNESAYITNVCRKVSELLGITIEETERITDLNARKLFRL